MPLLLKKNSGGGAPAYNKPPQDQSPDPDLYAWSHTFPDGKTIWRSYPLPDKLTLNAWLRKEHFQEKITDTVSLEEKVHILVKGLEGAHLMATDKAPFVSKTKLWAKFQFALGDRQSSVFIEIKEAAEDGATGYKIRLDFNPRKIGLAGCKQLQSILDQSAQGAFHLNILLADATISRLDVAVDYVDVHPADLIVTTKPEGQRVHYLGTDGALETVQVHRPTKRPFENPLNGRVWRDSSLGCGPQRRVAGWPRLRRRPSATRRI